MANSESDAAAQEQNHATLKSTFEQKLNIKQNQKDIWTKGLK